jgi:predicted protein tyrosine phosphatase
MSKTSKIFELTTPYNNKYQGNATRLLFVCSVGMLRSPTAADVATGMGFNARSCGADPVALIPLSANLIMWADKIVFMNRENYEEAMFTFNGTGYDEDIESKKEFIHVDDDYDRDDQQLRTICWYALKEFELERA